MTFVLNRHFARHYVEMVFVMFLGVAVLGPPAGLAIGLFDSSWSQLQDEAAAMLLLMAATMTVPMAAWMRRRGHGWRHGKSFAVTEIASFRAQRPGPRIG